jgi:hypothetical protein
LVQTLDNDAEVHFQNGGGNDVVIIQGELGGGEHNRAFVDIESQGWSNDVRIRQHILENDAIVQVGKEDGSDESFNNVIDLNQGTSVTGLSAGDGNNRAWVALDDAGNSQADISIKNSSSNRGENAWGYGSSGIHVVQSTGDYAGVFVTNSNANSVYVHQN